MALDVSILGLEGSQFYLCVCVCVHVLEKAHFLCRVSDLGDNIGAPSLCKLDRSWMLSPTAHTYTSLDLINVGEQAWCL